MNERCYTESGLWNGNNYNIKCELFAQDMPICVPAQNTSRVQVKLILGKIGKQEERLGVVLQYSKYFCSISWLIVF